MSIITLVLIGMMAASLVLNVIILAVVLATRNKAGTNTNGNPAAKPGQATAPAEEGVVFCRNCGSQYGSTLPVCPSCKVPH